MHRIREKGCDRVESNVHGSNKRKHIFRTTKKNVELWLEVLHEAEGSLGAVTAISYAGQDRKVSLLIEYSDISTQNLDVYFCQRRYHTVTLRTAW